MTEIKQLYYAKQRILMVLFRELTSIILVSEGGLGKSWLTIKTVKAHLKPGEYVYWLVIFLRLSCINCYVKI